MDIVAWFEEHIREYAALVEFEFEVARRADDLARQWTGARDRDTDRRLWAAAELNLCALGVACRPA